MRGVLSFIFVLLMMPLGHAFVVLMAKYLSGIYLTAGASTLGALGIALAVWSNRLRNRGTAAAIGAFGGVLVWGGWVEFTYISYAASLGVPPLIENGVVATKPEYLMMPAALPFAILTFIMMVYGGDTQWGIVRRIRRALKVKIEGRGANPGIWSLIELVLLIWYAYLALLLMYDKDILGDTNPVTLIFAFICLAVSIVLFIKQMRAPSWESGIRSSIVTVCIFWTWVEVMIRLKFFTEIWIHPTDYTVEMILLLVAFAGVTLFLLRKKDKYADN